MIRITPPITHEGMESIKAMSGVRKEKIIQPNAATRIVMLEALPVMATQAIDSPYVVFGLPPKNAPAIEPIPSPRRVLFRPGSVKRSFSIIEERFL